MFRQVSSMQIWRHSYYHLTMIVKCHVQYNILFNNTFSAFLYDSISSLSSTNRTYLMFSSAHWWAELNSHFMFVLFTEHELNRRYVRLYLMKKTSWAELNASSRCLTRFNSIQEVHSIYNYWLEMIFVVFIIINKIFVTYDFLYIIL